MRSPVSVLHFSDYRAFLLSYAQWRRGKNPQWSYSAWARRLGLKNTSSITKILQGKREPGSTILSRLVEYFQFPRNEADYFRDLVSLNKVKRDPRLSAAILERIQGASAGNEISQIDNRTFAVISSWYCFAIREMVELDQFVEDPQWIAQRFHSRLTPSEVKNAIKSLLAVGLLKRNPEGELAIAERRIETASDVASEAAKQHLEQMLDRAKEVIRTVGVAEREFSASCFVIKESDLPAAKETLRAFRARFCRLYERKDGDRVFQFQSQLFPLTRRGDIS